MYVACNIGGIPVFTRKERRPNVVFVEWRFAPQWRAGLSLVGAARLIVAVLQQI
jgi:hypothetical protein